MFTLFMDSLVFVLPTNCYTSHDFMSIIAIKEVVANVY